MLITQRICQTLTTSDNKCIQLQADSTMRFREKADGLSQVGYNYPRQSSPAARMYPPIQQFSIVQWAPVGYNPERCLSECVAWMVYNV